MPAPIRLPVPSPVRGIDRVSGRETQSPDSCWDALNVLPYDRWGRHRVAQRSGLAKAYSTNMGSTKVQGLLPVNNISYATTISSTANTPLSSFSHVPATVSTSGNSITWPGNYTPGAVTGVIVNSTITKPFTMTFNLVLSGSTASAAVDLYLGLANGSTSFANVAAGNDPIDVLWQQTNTPSAYNEVDVNATTNFASTSTPGQLPLNTNIPCILSWDGSGNVISALNGVSTSAVSYTSTASTMTLYAETPAGITLAMNNISFVTGTTVSTGTLGYQTLLLAVCQGFVWVGDSGSNLVKPTLGQSTAQLSSTNMVDMCYINGVVYIVDGSSTVHTYTIATSTVGTLTASKGTGVGGGSTSQYYLCCNWRGRLVLGGDANNPQLVYMSRMGDPTDWDYSQTDSAAAFSQNLSKQGQIGEAITALIPFSDDLLKIGCAHSLWMYQGDPAAGGNVVNVSNNMGIVGKKAWCVDPAGTLWFVATGGLFQVRPAWEFYRPPEPVSLNRINQSFTGLNPGTSYTSLAYDADLHYLHIFVTPIDGSAGTHLTLDTRSLMEQTGPSFWPQKFPSTCGPTVAVLFFSDGNPNNRKIVLGGTDGYIREWTDSALDDDGAAISASITLGPFQPVPGEAATLTGTTLDMGELPIGYASTAFNVQCKLSAGPDAYSVTEGLQNSANPHPIPVVNVTLERRQKTFRQRLRGGWFTINLANASDSTLFSFEGGVMEFVSSGPNRVRR